jgi:hypothetical protein
MQPVAATQVEEPAPNEALSPELQLAVALELLHRLDMAEKSKSLCPEELDLIQFLIIQVASLSSSLSGAR